MPSDCARSNETPCSMHQLMLRWIPIRAFNQWPHLTAFASSVKARGRRALQMSNIACRLQITFRDNAEPQRLGARPGEIVATAEGTIGDRPAGPDPLAHVEPARRY